MSKYKKCGYYSDGECSICGMGMSGEDTFCRLCKDNPNCYYKQLDKLRTEKDKYYQQTLDDEITLNELYQTLQEIKEIAETCMSKDGCFECKYSDDCWIEDAEFPTYDICKLLIQKITKAEEE